MTSHAPPRALPLISGHVQLFPKERDNPKVTGPHRAQRVKDLTALLLGFFSVLASERICKTVG